MLCTTRQCPLRIQLFGRIRFLNAGAGSAGMYSDYRTKKQNKIKIFQIPKNQEKKNIFFKGSDPDLVKLRLDPTLLRRTEVHGALSCRLRTLHWWAGASCLRTSSVCSASATIPTFGSRLPPTYRTRRELCR